MQPCRRHGKKRKEDEPDMASGKKDIKNVPEKMVEPNRQSLYHHQEIAARQPLRDSQLSLEMASMFEGMDAQLQSSQVSSTVLDSPVSMYPNWNYQNEQQWSRSGWLEQRKNNWMNPWSEFGSFGGLDREVKVAPDSTSLDDSSRPKGKVPLDDYRSANLQNSSSESPRSNYNLSSPRSNHVYSTPPRTGPPTPHDQRMSSPRSSGYSSAPSEYNMSTPSPRNYQSSIDNIQNSTSPRAPYQQPPFNLENQQRNTPTRNNQHPAAAVGPDTFRKNQSPNVPHLRSPGMAPSDNFTFNVSAPRYPNDQNQKLHLTQNNPEVQNTKSFFSPPKSHPSYPTHQEGQTSNHTNPVPASVNTNYLQQNSSFNPQLYSNQNYNQQSNATNTTDQKRSSGNSRETLNSNCPHTNEQSSWNSWGNETTKRPPVQSPSQNTQSGSFSKLEYGNISKPPWEEKLLQTDSSKSSWETPTEPPSPFRVPKGRPPSRTTPNHYSSTSVEFGNQHSNSVPKTFLKPQEPIKSNLIADNQTDTAKTYPENQNNQRKGEWPQDKTKEGKLFFH